MVKPASGFHDEAGAFGERDILATTGDVRAEGDPAFLAQDFTILDGESVEAKFRTEHFDLIEPCFFVFLEMVTTGVRGFHDVVHVPGCVRCISRPHQGFRGLSRCTLQQRSTATFGLFSALAWARFIGRQFHFDFSMGVLFFRFNMAQMMRLLGSDELAIISVFYQTNLSATATIFTLVVDAPKTECAVPEDNKVRRSKAVSAQWCRTKLNHVAGRLFERSGRFVTETISDRTCFGV